VIIIERKGLYRLTWGTESFKRGTITLFIVVCDFFKTICRCERLLEEWGLSRGRVIMLPDSASVAPAGSPAAKMIRVVIADDERLARQKMRTLLESEPNISVIAECQDGRQTVSAINCFHPDLLLLDIQMPDLDGFQVLSEVPAREMPAVIFTSAYDQYAIRAFEAHALDYLLKPFDQERLHNAIQRARVELAKSENREITHKLLELLSNIKSGGADTAAPDSQDRLVIKAKGRVIFLDLEEIDWVEAAANYVRLNVGKESYLLRETISRTAERLDPNEFIRIHRSTIVNVRKIKELIPVNSGEYIVVLKNGKELSCSRGYRALLQRIIERHS
jgi:two-component system, LytTR family, response regulator